MTLTKVIMTEWLKNCCSNFEFVVEQKFMSHWMSRQSMHCFGGKKCMKFDIEVLWRVEKQEQQTALWKKRETLWKNIVRSVYYCKFFFKRRRKSDYFHERVRKKSKIVTSCVQTVFVFFIGGDRKHRVASAPLSPFHFGLLTYTSSWPSTATHCLQSIKIAALNHSVLSIFITFNVRVQNAKTL